MHSGTATVISRSRGSLLLSCRKRASASLGVGRPHRTTRSRTPRAEDAPAFRGGASVPHPHPCASLRPDHLASEPAARRPADAAFLGSVPVALLESRRVPVLSGSCAKLCVAGGA